MKCEAAVPSTADGKLNGAVNLERMDGKLELTELRYDLSGEYSCRVEVNSDAAKDTAPWEVLIVGESCHTHPTILHVFNMHL